MPENPESDAVSRMVKIARDYSLNYSPEQYSQVELRAYTRARFTDPNTDQYFEVVFDPTDLETPFQQYSCSNRNMGTPSNIKDTIRELRAYLADLEKAQHDDESPEVS